MKNWLLLLIIVIILCSCCSQSQTVIEYKQLPMLSIDNENLIPLIDHSIEYYQNGEEKPDSLFFIINTHKRPEYDFYIFQIDSDEHRITIFNGYIEPIGFFYRNNHLFVVYDKDSEQFFSETNIKKKFRYDPKIKDKLQVIDDSHPFWVYCYQDGKFVLLKECLPY